MTQDKSTCFVQCIALAYLYTLGVELNHNLLLQYIHQHALLQSFTIIFLRVISHPVVDTYKKRCDHTDYRYLTCLNELPVLSLIMWLKFLKLSQVMGFKSGRKKKKLIVLIV